MYQQASIRYRPQFFRDILGQIAPVRVLQNSIRYDKISHAYLFSGKKGTGKTSAARVLAKAINCDVLDKDEIEPCGTCISCINIKDCRDPNVTELDAASHGLKEDIAELHKMAVQMPYPGKKKIFIIDECHVLTTQAQSAFLKLLEEPPKDVIFMLLTTEPNKLLDTIISRCFRLDFRSIPIPEVDRSIRRIFEDSKIVCPDSVIRMILSNCDGSLRDIQQLADQLISVAQDNVVSEQDVNELFGYLTVSQFKELADLLCSRSYKEWLLGIADFWDMGYDLDHILSNCIEMLLRDFRCALVCDETWEFLSGIPYESLHKNMNLTMQELDVLQQVLEEALENKRNGMMTRLNLEMMYIKFLDELATLI